MVNKCLIDTTSLIRTPLLLIRTPLVLIRTPLVLIRTPLVLIQTPLLLIRTPIVLIRTPLVGNVGLSEITQYNHTGQCQQRTFEQMT